LGLEGVLLAIFLAYLLAGVILVAPLVLGKVRFGQQVPFGPALVAGAFIVLFFRSQILVWYMNFILGS
jgi:prepilin signal peptidase PulO-like enzyme (type II secretory pathway)